MTGGPRSGAELDPMNQPRAGTTSMLESLLPALGAWLPAQRWFGAKDRTVAGVRLLGHQEVTPADAVPAVAHAVIAVEFTDDGPEEHLQLLLGSRTELPGDLDHAVIGRVADRTVYDGLADGEISRLLLSLIVSDTTIGSLRFTPEPETEAPIVGPGRPLLGEQSNSSVVYGERAILKLFRRATAGLNPDLELHRALRRQHSAEVAPLIGAIEGELDDGAGGAVPMTVAMLQDYASNSADGWSMALTSVRDLLAEGDLRPDEVGGDFAGEATRLGRTVGSVHRELAEALGTTWLDAAGVRGVADWMLARLDLAAAAVPRSPSAARRSAGARGRQRGGRHRPAGAPHPRRPAPGPGAAHAARLAASSTSRASRPARWPTACARTPRCVTWRRCSGRSTTPRSTSSPSGSRAPSRPATCSAAPRSGPTATARPSATATRRSTGPTRARTSPCCVPTSSTRPSTRCVYETRNRPNWLAIPLRSMERLIDSP